jgi:hypothetical protein
MKTYVSSVPMSGGLKDILSDSVSRNKLGEFLVNRGQGCKNGAVDQKVTLDVNGKKVTVSTAPNGWARSKTK